MRTTLLLLLLLALGCAAPVDDVDDAGSCPRSAFDEALDDVDEPGFYMVGAWFGDFIGEDGCGSSGLMSQTVWWAEWPGDISDDADRRQAQFSDAVAAASFTGIVVENLTPLTDARAIVGCLPVGDAEVECWGFRRTESDRAVVIAGSDVGGTSLSRLYIPADWGVFTDVELPPAASD